MPKNAVTKELFSLLAALFCVLIGGYYLLNYLDKPNPHCILISETEISKDVFVYCIEFESLMTGSDWYKYYLSPKLGNPTKTLKKEYPFLVTDSGDAKIALIGLSYSNNLQKKELHLSVKFSGKIHSFSNTDYLRINSQSLKVKINLIADYP